MKTFAELMVEAEGFQGKFTPDHDTKKQAITLNNKVTPKAKNAAEKGAAIVRTKQGGTGKEAIGRERKSGPGVRQEPQNKGPGNKKYDRAQPGLKGGPITRYKKPEEPQDKPRHKKGFASGVKTSLGGDLFDKNDSNRTRARRELGLKTGKAIKSAPGKLASSIKNAKTTQDGPSESGSGSSGIQAAKRGVYNG